MKAIAVKYNEASKSQLFEQIEVPVAWTGDFDLLVEVKGIGLNPVDTKIAAGINQEKPGPRILGWDASGVVLEVGSKVSNFKIGDEVYYAGDVTKDGNNSEKHVIDSRIVSKKPSSIDFKTAAAFPLTTLTAWEGIFSGLSIDPRADHSGKTILVIGGAGGVGSMVIQLIKHFTKMKVVATSSRKETTDWALKMGADQVINYKDGLKEASRKIGITEYDYIYCTNNTDAYFGQFSDVTRPFGKIVTIVETKTPLDFNALKSKSISFAWEFMFTKSMHQTQDMHTQGEILRTVAGLIDNKKIQSTVYQDLGDMTVENIKKGHEILKSGQAIGKIIMGGLV